MPSLHLEPLSPAGSAFKMPALGQVEPLAQDEEVLQGRYGDRSTSIQHRSIRSHWNRHIGHHLPTRPAGLFAIGGPTSGVGLPES